MNLEQGAPMAAGMGTEPSRSRRPSAPHEGSHAHRQATVQFGMWVFLASEVLFFGGLFLAYTQGRVNWPAGFAAASRHTDVWLGTLNTALLLTSSGFAALAAEFSAREVGAARRHARICLWATVALGLTFLAVKGFEWHSEWIEGLFPGPGFQLEPGQAPPMGAEQFFMLYFVMTGLHALHMVAGVIVMGVLAWRAEEGVALPIEAAALYWHFVDIVWIFLYPLLYLVERHS